VSFTAGPDNRTKLRNLDVLLTSDWDALSQFCQFEYPDAEFNVVDNPRISDSQREIDQIQDLPMHERSIEELQEMDLDKYSVDEQQKILRAMVIRWHLAVMKEMLDRSVASGHTLVWNNEQGRWLCDIYVRHLLRRLAHREEPETPYTDQDDPVKISHLIGTAILEDLFKCDAFNLLSVPPHKIVEFRRKYNDLLVNFQDEYWKFVLEIQDDPKNSQRHIENYATRIRTGLRALDGEISTIRRKKGYAWLRRMGDEVYSIAITGAAIAALWNIGSPTLLIGPVAGWLVAQFAKFGNDVISEREQVAAALQKCSFSYVWKAERQFGHAAG
jgi:hypothetical protein